MSIDSRKTCFFILTALTVLLLSLVLTDWLPILRGPAPGSHEWHWIYAPRPADRWWAPLLASLLSLLAVAWWLRRSGNKQWETAVGLVGLVLGSLLLQLGLIYADRPAVAAELVDRTLAMQTNGFLWTAAETEDLGALLRTFPEAMPDFASDHLRTHPPGLLVANWLTIRIFEKMPNLAELIAKQIWPLRCTDLWLLERSASVAAALGFWAFLPLVLGALTPIPAYLLARRWSGPAGARLAAALVAALPATLLFAPFPDQVYGLLSLVSMLALDVALERRAKRWFFATGLILSLSSFLSLGNGALLLAMAAHTIMRVGRGRPALRHSWLWAFGIGAASIWLLAWLGWGAEPWEIARAGIQQHYQLVTSQRRYGWWLVYNLVDLLIFAGLPLMIGFVLATLEKSAAKMMGMALALLILILDLSGSARGEVGRLWLFFMPLLAVVSGGALARRLPGSSRVTLLVGLQVATAVSLGIAWRPVDAVIVVADRPEMPQHHAAQTPLGTLFGEGITLNGYDLDSRQAIPGGRLDLTLIWKARSPSTRPYTVFAHLVNEEGQLVAQEDNWPVNGLWPPTCWRREEVVTDPRRIALPAELPAGRYSLWVGLYDATDGSRLHTIDGRDAVRLAEIEISP